MSSISVIIVTKNEAHNIKACLESVAFADEIIIYDSGSTDNTVEIAKAYTSHITVTDWPGDGPQKNRALAHATSDWVLCLDADERVSPALRQEIQDCLSRTDCHGFDIPYQSSYLNKMIRFGDWRNEKHRRLFKLDKGRFTEDVVHCHLQIEGKVGLLKHPIYHHPFKNVEHLLQKLNDYSTQSALHKFKQGKKASLWTALSHGMWTFIRGYLIKFGFLDGKEGFMLALSNAQGTYYRYVKLMYLGKEKKNNAH